ncbi:MAG: aldolase/citrate lyase family protein, partial [Limnobacter sp.]|nr:aldolase/citrate lyase family protein [Limnobacter sp.]
MGACFDITLDLEDGAIVGQESDASKWAAASLNHFRSLYGDDARRPGVRVHPVNHAAFIQDIETLLVPEVASPAYIMLPKAESLKDVVTCLDRMEAFCTQKGAERPPLHVLIETHGALAEVQGIAARHEVESLSFGLMDFVSSHRSAIPKSALNTP